MKSLTDRKSNAPKIILEPEPADVLVIGALGAILIKELKKSSYFKESCFSTYRKDGTIVNYLERLRTWEEIDSLVRIDLSRSINTFSRSRLIEKVQALLQDTMLTRLFSSFCDLLIFDFEGKDIDILLKEE